MSDCAVVYVARITNTDSLMNADPGLPRRFATHLHLEDYTPTELSRIAQGVASGLGLSFAPGLLEDLAGHIGSAHAGDISKNNGGLAVNLTERAFMCLAERCIDTNLGVGPESRVLTPVDYRIGVGTPPNGEAGGAVDAAAPEPEPVPEEPALSFAEVLASLDVEGHAEGLAAECVTTLEDLTLLSEGNLQELGFKMGERNRVLGWSGARETGGQIAALRAELKGIRADLHSRTASAGADGGDGEEERLAAESERARRGQSSGGKSSGGAAPRGGGASQNQAKVQVKVSRGALRLAAAAADDASTGCTAAALTRVQYPLGSPANSSACARAHAVDGSCLTPLSLVRDATGGGEGGGGGAGEADGAGEPSVCHRRPRPAPRLCHRRLRQHVGDDAVRHEQARAR